MPLDCLIRRGWLVLEDQVVAADLGIAAGRIVALGPDLAETGREEIDAAGLHLLPGVVDAHVHFNDPGRSDWEGGATGSAALAAGGGTCFVDMPLNASPPTLDAASLALKKAALSQTSHADFALWGGLVPGNSHCLEELAAGGVVGFKAFLCNSGIDDFHAVDLEQLGRGMEVAARLGLPVAVHAEDEALTQRLTSAARAAGRHSVRDFLNSRPIEAETIAVAQVIQLAAQTGCALHVVHVSSSAAVQMVVQAQARGVNVTCETCPHYLTLTEDDVERIGAAAKCAPPVRDAQQREQLWAALLSGQIAWVASDHSPAPWSLKQSADFFAAWGGIAGCQTMLGLLLYEGCVLRQMPWPRLAAVLGSAPARRFQLLGKGELTVGADADLTLVDTASRPTLQAESLLYRHPLSPFVGRTLGGTVRRTLLRGRTIWADGRIVGPPGGQFVRPGTHLA